MGSKPLNTYTFYLQELVQTTDGAFKATLSLDSSNQDTSTLYVANIIPQHHMQDVTCLFFIRAKDGDDAIFNEYYNAEADVEITTQGYVHVRRMTLRTIDDNSFTFSVPGNATDYNVLIRKLPDKQDIYETIKTAMLSQARTRLSTGTGVQAYLNVKIRLRI